MSKESDFLLGLSFGLLTVIRTYLINKDDAEAIKLIEDEYQTLHAGISRTFYSKDDTHAK